MATKTYLVNGNQAYYSDEEFSSVLTEVCEEGVLNLNGDNTDLKVTEKSTPNMSVDIKTGGVVNTYLKNLITWKVIGKSAAVENILIPSNTSGSDRVDAIVVHFTQDDPNELKNNIMEIIRVAGTGATPLTDGNIDTAVGDTNWYRLADVVVPDSATQILNADIIDTRLPVGIGKNSGGYKSLFRGDGSLLEGLLNSPVNEDILPDTPSLRDIGAPANRFDNGYFNYLFGDASGLTNVPKGATEYEYVYGESISVNDILFLADGNEPTNTVRPTSAVNSSTAIYTTYWRGQTFIARVCGVIKGATINFANQGTPNFDITIAIRGVDALGMPTGPNLAETTVLGTTLTSNMYVPFTTPITLTVGVKYALIVYPPAGGGNGSNYVRWYGGTVETNYTDGEGVESNNAGSSWSGNQNDRNCEFTFHYGNYEAGKVYKASSAHRAFIDRLIGIANQVGVYGNLKYIKPLLGKCGGFTGLTPGQMYYLGVDQTIADMSSPYVGGTTYQIGYANPQNYQYAQGFTILRRQKLLSYTVRVGKVGSPTGNLVAELRGGTDPMRYNPTYSPDVNGGGFLLATQSVNYLNIPGGTDITFTFGSGVILEPGDYYVKLSHDTQVNGNYFTVQGTGSYINPLYWGRRYNPSSPSWTATNAVDFYLDMETGPQWDSVFGAITTDAYLVKHPIGRAVSATEMILLDKTYQPKQQVIKSQVVQNFYYDYVYRIPLDFRPRKITVYAVDNSSDTRNECKGIQTDYIQGCHYQGYYTAYYRGVNTQYPYWIRPSSGATYGNILIKNDSIWIYCPYNVGSSDAMLGLIIEE